MRTSSTAAATPEPVSETPLTAREAVEYIVGIGASAGGLGAFIELLSHLPDDTGMAFVLIQHLDPTHESHLTSLLSKSCRLPVSEVTRETRVQANCVYVIPPGFNLILADGVLNTTARPGRGRNMPIDSFLGALAADRGSKAIGVILSGTASDGTLGLEAIKTAGGVTLAQEMRTAKFDGMPGSAIAAGVVDFVLPPGAIAAKLVEIARGASLDVHRPPDLTRQAELNRIFHLLRNATGVDFTHYKSSTLARRIKLRMDLRGFASLEDYSRDLEHNGEEANALCDTFFITVTAFFREPAVFDALKARVFPALVENRAPGDPIRIWIPGCATGEEAYSIAICLKEFLDQAGLDFPFEVFGTDISETAIELARVGVYAELSLAPISPPRRAKFFANTEGGARIAPKIRDACVFARHNVTQDPPFSRLDLISCCNVLIYLEPVLQRKVLATLHYALKPAGFLVLGPSESTGALSDSFLPVEHADKIYSVQAAGKTHTPLLGDGQRAHVSPQEPASAARARLQAQLEADRLVLAEYAPPGAIVDSDLNVVQVRGRTAPYLELSPGEPTQRILKMAREGLIVGLAKAFRAARKLGGDSVQPGFRIDSSGKLQEVTVKVTALAAAPPAVERFFLVQFEDTPPAGTARRKPAHPVAGPRESARLRRDLVGAREHLQSIVEDKATTLAELQAANEVAQAANEELETAQEELESANEELNTLNEHLKISNGELSYVNRDLANLLESISIPLVMVGRDLRIRRFTRAIEPLLNLITSDVGRPITDLQPQMDLPDLRSLLLSAMERGDRKPRDVRDPHGRWFSLRILPSVGADGRSDGAVLMLLDIDAAKRGLDFAEAIVETVREPLVILNQNLEVLKANRSFYETFQAEAEETEGRLIYDLGNGQWNIPRLRELLESILPTHSSFRDFEVTHDFEHVGRKVMLLNAAEIFNPSAQARTILLAIEDATVRRQAEDALRATNAELQHFAYALAHDLHEPLRMVVNFTQLLRQEYDGKLGPDADRFISYSIEGALRIEALLKALLSYWEATERELAAVAAIDCGAVLAKAILNLHTAIQESGAVVTSDSLPTIAADEVMLIQLFQNLISNSVKYRGEAVPRVHVSAHQNGTEWVFAVRDNGIGIEPRYFERVFGMFKRLHGREIPGTGIGLALCKRVVERQGGRIWVESEAGQGATFKFTVPGGQRFVPPPG